MRHILFPLSAPTDYLRLYTPALDWIIQCIAFKSPEVSQLEVCAGLRGGAPAYLTPADKILKNYFIFQRTFGNERIKLLNDLKLLQRLITCSDPFRNSN